ncbi:beta-ketoacyl-ACP synthase I, partial [Buchnera aphidicola (Hormaphis cornu)]
AMGALSRKYNKYPHRASCPYDKNRDGFVISGGAGVVILEELQHALLRKSKIYAEIIGYGATSDGHNMVIPSIEGSIRCMQLSLLGINNLKVDYLNAHGTSTLIGDIKELHAILRVFGKDNIPFISSTKSMTGHSLGASGVQEVIYTLLMLKYNFIAPSINIQKIDSFAKKMKIVTKKINSNIMIAMSNSFGFGGSNATIVLKKYY